MRPAELVPGASQDDNMVVMILRNSPKYTAKLGVRLGPPL
jgi:hypothetical protein